MNDLENKLHNQFNQTFKINQPTETVYHYTSFSNLEKILTSKTFWLTDYRYLNDSSEIEYARTQILNIILKIILNLPDSKLWITFYDSFARLPLSHHIYVFSTCERQDYLPAWRAYADNGAGIAIGIMPELFGPQNTKISQATTRCCDSAKVHYDTSFIECYLQNFFKEIGNSSLIKKNSFSSIVMSYLVALYPLIKHPAYKEEIEFRLFEFEEKEDLFKEINKERHLIVPKENKIWSPDKNEKHPFVKSIPRVITNQFDESHIKNIWIGPRCNKENARKEIQQILDEQGYTKTEIEFSSIPYR